MATFKKIDKTFEFNGKFSIRDIFSALSEWAKRNGLKEKGVTDEFFSPEPLTLSKTLNFSKTIQDEKIIVNPLRKLYSPSFSHKYSINVNITGKRDENKIKGKLTLQVSGVISDNEKEDPFFNWKRILKRRFTDVYLKENDVRKTKELEKTIDAVKDAIDKIIEK